MEIHIEQDELIPRFNSRFYQTLMDIPKNYRPHDQICLVIYLDALGQKMSFLLRDKQPQSLYQACEIAMDIECNLKYGVIRRRTPAIVKDLVEFSELRTCVDEVSLL